MILNIIMLVATKLNFYLRENNNSNFYITLSYYIHGFISFHEYWIPPTPNSPQNAETLYFLILPLKLNCCLVLKHFTQDILFLITRYNQNFTKSIEGVGECLLSKKEYYIFYLLATFMAGRYKVEHVLLRPNKK